MELTMQYLDLLATGSEQIGGHTGAIIIYIKSLQEGHMTISYDEHQTLIQIQNIMDQLVG
jgi:hypothetical protein